MPFPPRFSKSRDRIAIDRVVPATSTGQVLDNVVAVVIEHIEDAAHAVPVLECDVDAVADGVGRDEATVDPAALALCGRAVELGEVLACCVGLGVTGVGVD